MKDKSVQYGVIFWGVFICICMLWGIVIYGFIRPKPTSWKGKVDVTVTAERWQYYQLDDETRVYYNNHDDPGRCIIVHDDYRPLDYEAVRNNDFDNMFSK